MIYTDGKSTICSKKTQIKKRGIRQYPTEKQCGNKTVPLEGKGEKK